MWTLSHGLAKTQDIEDWTNVIDVVHMVYQWLTFPTHVHTRSYTILLGAFLLLWSTPYRIHYTSISVSFIRHQHTEIENGSKPTPP